MPGMRMSFYTETFDQSETLQKPSGRSLCDPQEPEVAFSAL